jgi:hypothetical protein
MLASVILDPEFSFLTHYTSYTNLLASSMEASTYNLFEGLNTHLLMLNDARAKSIALTIVPKIVTLLIKRFRCLFPPIDPDILEFEDGDERNRWSMSSRAQVKSWFTIIIKNEMSHTFSIELNNLLNECVQSGNELVLTIILLSANQFRFCSDVEEFHHTVLYLNHRVSRVDIVLCSNLARSRLYSFNFDSSNCLFGTVQFSIRQVRKRFAKSS